VSGLGMVKQQQASRSRGGFLAAAVVLAACMAVLPAALRAQQGPSSTPAQNPSQTASQTQTQQAQSQTQTAQSQLPPVRLANSDPLASLNLEQVAASAAEIRAVLNTDPGLMIEVKRLLALRATEHGQILTHDDLTDEAIYEKLHDDIKFRSAVTLLLQRYGYLTPKVDPNSEMGQQLKIQMQERAIQLARIQEQQRTNVPTASVQATGACDPQLNPNCSPALPDISVRQPAEQRVSAVGAAESKRPIAVQQPAPAPGSPAWIDGGGIRLGVARNAGDGRRRCRNGRRYVGHAGSRLGNRKSGGARLGGRFLGRSQLPVRPHATVPRAFLSIGFGE
jgi:hypothetical protein